jgi:hypothetical protein
MDSAASTAKGGFVRDALVGSYPRMAALLEEALLKLQRDTNASICGILSSFINGIPSDPMECHSTSL